METSVWSLWLPILISGIALFFASWVAWMFMPHHKTEWNRLPDEDAVMNALRAANIPPGQYTFPRPATHTEWNTEEFKAKIEAGPSGSLVLSARPGNMGRNMIATVIFFILVNFVIAYLAGQALQPGTPFWKVFQFVGTAGMLTYGTASILNGIWFGRKMAADIADGIAYGVLTGMIFAILWPAATAT
jgi:hypothetical protein